ncbi:MAG: helix-turn-helix transcriptional regulator [Nitrococcus sp.]|nr:helix-turn-helix transcriptional regulator [Nitrococcus sp.]
MTKLAGLKEGWMKDPEFREEYERLGPELALAAELIAARSRAGLTQAEVARRMGSTQSVVARLESGSTIPTWRTLRRYAEATGHKAAIHLERESG